MNSIVSNNVVYAIEDKYYCFWSRDLRTDAVDFLATLNPDYFMFVANHAKQCQGNAELEMYAGTNLRIAFFQSAEMLMLLIGAILQAPACPQAFVGKCSNAQLRSIVERITNDKKLDGTPQTPLPVVNRSFHQLSWDAIAAEVMRQSGFRDDLRLESERLFADFWRRIAERFLDPVADDEYNSLKHGFRVGAGGHSLVMHVEPPPGQEPVVPRELRLGDSKFGTSFEVIKSLTDNDQQDRSRVSEYHSVNWSFDDVVLSVEMIYLSIVNAIACLNTYSRSATAKYFIPTSKIQLPSVSCQSFSLQKPVAGAMRTTKESIADLLERNRQAQKSST